MFQAITGFIKKSAQSPQRAGGAGVREDGGRERQPWVNVKSIYNAIYNGY